MLSIIAAIGDNRELGKDNKLLWDIPEDMEHFRSLTRNHTVIMGRKTYESIGHPLPDRTNIIVTSDQMFTAPSGCIIAHSLDEAIQKSHDTETFIIGGASVYAQALPITDKLYLTKVRGTFDADAYFPDYSRFSTVVSSVEKHDDKYTYTFLELTPS